MIDRRRAVKVFILKVSIAFLFVCLFYLVFRHFAVAVNIKSLSDQAPSSGDLQSLIPARGR